MRDCCHSSRLLSKWLSESRPGWGRGTLRFGDVMVMDDYSRFALTSASFIEVIHGLEGPDPLTLQSNADNTHEHDQRCYQSCRGCTDKIRSHAHK